MKSDIADQIVMAAGHLGFDFQSRPYSGRGMAGAETTAISISSDNEFAAFAAAVGQAAIDAIDPAELIRAVKRVRTDSLGKEMIVY